MIRIPKVFDVKCHEPTCDKHADLYRYPELGDEESTLAVFYCPKHAEHHGFCSSCGEFLGGLESFEFNGTRECCYDEIEEAAPSEFDWEPSDGWNC